ncbi:ZCWPW1 [Branchiostoma lanceolatum]|uniref:ZCWPW1 protein n=1 Tax=Branchiostoma lanceolatum TaxID=7740 RepID=A0A8J9W339_BRALA|nr:ZCWPW1 [Branchiostoma lanceolatum]
MPQIKEWTEEIFALLRSQSITLRSKGPVCCEDKKKKETEKNADEQSDSSREDEYQSDDSLKEETRIQLEHEAWIQCDKCSKWRRVTKEVAAEYANKDWLCSLNADSKHSSCTDVEETHDEREAQKYGLRYVCSEISVGSLVWARLDGFAKWPAVLTPDPENGDHTEVDEDGDVTWYHVEFLGPKPSHSWCTYNRVELYGKTDAARNVAQVGESKTRKKGRRYPRLTTPKTGPTPQQKNLNAAIKEADYLKSLTNKQRLLRCHFKWSPRTTGDSDEDSSKGYRPTSNPVVESTHCRKVSTGMRNTGKKGTIKNSCLTTNRQTEDTDSRNKKHKNMRASGTVLQCSSAPSILPPDLGSCTEKDFGMMVSAFMTSHGKHVSSPPVWNGSKVSLYQLFTAVMEKGGYSQLSKRGKAGGWSGIYRLLAKCSMSSHGGQAAKKYYERNLLPYEMFLSGCSVEEIQQVMKTPPCQPNDTFVPNTEKHWLGEDPPEDTLDEEMLKMEDMENILISLDDSIKTGMYDAKSDAGNVRQTSPAPLLKFYSNMYEDEASGDYVLASSSLMEVDADMSFLPAVEVGVPAAEVERHEASMMEELEAMQVDLEELNTSLGQELIQL